jgi:hypothetical protein
MLAERHRDIERERDRERDMKMVGARSKGEKGMACELTRGPLPAALAASSAFCFSSIFFFRAVSIGIATGFGG